MIPIVTPLAMAEMEKKSYEEGCSESAFMEEAGTKIARYVEDFAKNLELERSALLLLGKGNNAGDALVAGTHLLRAGWKVVAAMTVPIEELKPLPKEHYALFLHAGGQAIPSMISYKDMRLHFSLLIDGIFGTGFTGKVEEPYATLIYAANQSELPILSIDIPSGLNGETGRVEKIAIEATATLSLGFPKCGFFLEEGWNHVGEIEILDFGLPHKFIEKVTPPFLLANHLAIQPLRPKMVRNRHKYNAGLVVGVGGSPAMSGAVRLATESALRVGAGMMKLLHPKGMEIELAGTIPEVIKIAYSPNEMETTLELLTKAQSLFVGPGMGRSKEASQVLQFVLKHASQPLVIDADALTLLAEDPSTVYPKDSILTPHRGEMDRLLGIKEKEPLSLSYMKKCQEFCNAKNVVLLLKGGPSFVFSPKEIPVVIPTGSPGMATAGSGDVLTGVLAGLLGEGLRPKAAALFGAYLHGLAGELAAMKESPYAMIASDITKNLGRAYWELLS